MDYLRDTSLKRLDDFLEKLNNFILQNDDDDQLSQENIAEYVSYLIVKYVTSICNGEDFEPSSDTSNEKIEESYESQKLVEFDCNEVYTSRMCLVLKNFTSSNLTLETFFDNNSQFYCHTTGNSGNVYTDSSNNDNTSESASYVIYSKKEVSVLLKSGYCKLAIDLIGDIPLSDQGVGINYLKHGKLILKRFSFLLNRVCPLRRELHVNYIRSHLSQDNEMLKTIDLGYLDSSRPWIIYWALHSLLLLRHDIQSYKQRSLNSIMKCWDNEFGGFGGGEYQRAHVATTYAALCVLKMFNSVYMVNVELLYSFLMDMKTSDGSFSATYGGERDTRSTYCAIASAYIAGILTEDLTENTLEYIISCQTYEGGLSAEPYLEAHAGYTYCGLACISIIIANTLNIENSNNAVDTTDTVSNVKNKLDLMKVYEWCVNRLTPQFGFQGRPHKLVDSCYSFWVGASILIIEQLFVQLDKFYSQNDTKFYNRGDRKLYEELVKCYLLVVAQTGKGFRDKPGKPSDLYHTCYSLSYLNLIDNNLPHDILLNLTT